MERLAQRGHAVSAGAASDIGHCRDCGATVRWSVTASGSRIPLNPIPIRVAVGLQSDGGTVVVREAFAIHFTTCKKKPASRRRRT